MGLLSLAKAKKSSTSDLPQTYTFSSDSLTVTTMSTTSGSTSGSRPTSRHYDTGFPISFASCTTSMRHPDAVLDPTFAISAEHIDSAKSMHRSRRSLLRKHRRTISYGKINEGDFAEGSSRLPTADGAADFAGQKSHNMSVDSVHSSATSAASAGSSIQAKPDILGLSTPFAYPDDLDDSEDRRRSNIFRKLMNKN